MTFLNNEVYIKDQQIVCVLCGIWQKMLVSNKTLSLLNKVRTLWTTTKMYRAQG